MAKVKAGRPKDQRASARLPTLAPLHRKVLDNWFDNGCVSKRRAMVAAGYADNTARYAAGQVFNRPDVMSEISRRRDLQEKRRTKTEDDIIAEYEKLAFSNLGDLLEVNEDGSAYLDMSLLTPDMRAAVAEYQVETYEERGEPNEDGAPQSVKVKKARIKFSDKKAALDSLARIKGMFKDRVEVTGAMSLVERLQKGRERAAGGKDGK